MTLGEFLEQVRGMPPDTLLCVAEEDEASGMNVAAVEVVRDARRQSDAAGGAEAIELAAGDEAVVVLRW